MSTCSCPKQDQYANCCYRKKAEEKLANTKIGLKDSKTVFQAYLDANPSSEMCKQFVDYITLIEKLCD